jgi:hypothetical protein
MRQKSVNNASKQLTQSFTSEWFVKQAASISSRTQCEQYLQNAHSSWLLAGCALDYINQKRLWGDNFKDFDHYVQSHWDIKKSMAHQWIKASKACIEYLKECNKLHFVDLSKKHWMKLSTLPEDEREEILKAALIHSTKQSQRKSVDKATRKPSKTRDKDEQGKVVKMTPSESGKAPRESNGQAKRQADFDAQYSRIENFMLEIYDIWGSYIAYHEKDALKAAQDKIASAFKLGKELELEAKLNEEKDTEEDTTE